MSLLLLLRCPRKAVTIGRERARRRGDDRFLLSICLTEVTSIIRFIIRLHGIARA